MTKSIMEKIASRIDGEDTPRSRKGVWRGRPDALMTILLAEYDNEYNWRTIRSPPRSFGRRDMSWLRPLTLADRRAKFARVARAHFGITAPLTADDELFLEQHLTSGEVYILRSVRDRNSDLAAGIRHRLDQGRIREIFRLELCRELCAAEVERRMIAGSPIVEHDDDIDDRIEELRTANLMFRDDDIRRRVEDEVAEDLSRYDI